MKLILHIGSSKTGSTALQLFLNKNRAKLQSHGVLYPRIGMASHAHHVLAACFHQDAIHMHRQDIDRPVPQMIAGFRDAFRRLQEAQDHDTLIVSSDYLWNLRDRQPLIAFFRDLGYEDITVFCYLRELADWVQSQYFQATKGGERRKFRPWLRHFIGAGSVDFDYGANLGHWDVLPAVTRVTARVYGPETLPHGVCADFLRFVGVPGDGFAAESHAVNRSPTEAIILVMAQLNAMLLPEQEKQALRTRLLALAPLRSLHAPMHFIMPFELDMLRKQYGASLADVEARFVVPEHADQTLLRRQSPTRDRTHFNDDALEHVLTALANAVRKG